MDTDAALAIEYRAPSIALEMDTELPNPSVSGNSEHLGPKKSAGNGASTGAKNSELEAADSAAVKAAAAAKTAAAAAALSEAMIRGNSELSASQQESINMAVRRGKPAFGTGPGYYKDNAMNRKLGRVGFKKLSGRPPGS